MIDDPILRDALDAHLRGEPPMRLTPETVVRSGRRRRAVRQTATAAFSALTVAIIALGIHAAATSNISQPAKPDVSSPSDVEQPELLPGIGNDPKYTDSLASVIPSVVRVSLPYSPLSLRNIYPSDWLRDNALAPEQAHNATDWHAIYQVGLQPWHELWVSAYLNPPDKASTAAKAHAACKSVRPICLVSKASDTNQVSSGSYFVVQVTFIGNGTWARSVINVRYGDRSVTVQEQVVATGLADAKKKFAIPLGRMKQLAEDPRLFVPEPQVRPPAGRR
ncbi:hypothetical protein OG394_08120 [Kribbella sp. NBC_01245]|uniref:hypothetical protein n=1 Tax=Kribbella sp. NBC_01245 TaxID=2903578 RepID=UPI002E2B04D3|nr:hypothetical protein [Kribbella sp. NBC_01245]